MQLHGFGEAGNDAAQMGGPGFGDELVAEPFVQTAAEILGDATRYERINARMETVLELLAERCT